MSSAVEIHQPPLVKFLLDPMNHRERPRVVELIETHISWVFLTDRFAYKLKKPVRFSFLDFATAASRHRACLDELRLNRRLAGNVYLDVLALGQLSDGSFVWGERGEVVDWVVKMRRLPDAASLQQHLTHGKLSDRTVDALARFLTDFYRQQPPLTLRPEQTRRRLVELIRANQADLCASAPDEIHRINSIHAGQLRYVATHIALLDSRVCDGRYVEGHGDLRPEHIYLLPRPVVIDCIEFSAELRGVDIIDDLAFLAMECDRLGRPEVGDRIVQIYRAIVGDQSPASLFGFYKAYRACVRAKVNALRAAQESGEARVKTMKSVSNYLALAEANQRQLGRSLLVVVSGLMGSGKTTLASSLAETWGARHLQTDDVRREKFGISTVEAKFGEGRYRQDRRDEVYRAMLERCGQLLAAGESVILDGTFGTVWQRQAAEELAAQRDADFLLVRCNCPREIALRRIEQRRRSDQSTSEARADLYDQQQAAWESDGAPHPAVYVDTRQSLQEQTHAVLSRVSQQRTVRGPSTPNVP